MVERHRISLIEWGVAFAALILLANAFLVPGPLTIHYQAPKPLAYQPSCSEGMMPGECRALADAAMVDTVQPGQVVYRWQEWTLTDCIPGTVTVTYSQHSFVHTESKPTFCEVGTHAKAIRSVLPRDLIKGQDVQILATIEYPRSILPSWVVILPPVVARVI